MERSLVIDERYCGPPGLGNGGYVCGRLAAEIDGAAEVTLRLGTPVGRPLTLTRDGAHVRLSDGDAAIAEAQPAAPAALQIDTPPPPSFAAAARAPYTGFHRHAFPRCFGCGPERAPGDGLRVMPGPVGNGLLAAAWEPAAAFADAAGTVRPEFLWAALDCPGGWAVIGDSDRRVLLGRMTARIDRPVRAGERCVVTAWQLGGSGRKHEAGSAIYGADGGLAALARATWIEVPPPTAGSAR